MVSIVSSVITGFLALLGVIFTSSQGNRRMEHQLDTNQRVTETKLDALAHEVRELKEEAKDIPRLVERVNGIEKRVDKLEGRGK